MPTKHQRYVNNELLGFISRPQFEFSCSLSSLTAVFNYLYSDQLGILSSQQLAKAIQIPAPEQISTGPGNETLMGWFDALCKHYGVNGKSNFFIKDKDVSTWDKNPQIISKLKEAIHSKDQALIYHLKGHYNIVIGYFEHATYPEDAYEDGNGLQRWIIFGEHSDYIPLKGVVKTIKFLDEDAYNLAMDKYTGPIWCRRWRSIRHDIIQTPNHCIMSFTK